MTATYKIFVYLLFASAINLNSCVNEVKKDPTPEAPMDTNYLHEFTRVELSFIVPCKYYDLPDSTLAISFYSYGQPAIIWNKNSFQINVSHDTSYGVFDLNHNQTASVSQRSGFSIGLYLSRSGSQIDSGWYGIHSWDSLRVPLFLEIKDSGKYLKYISLPQNFISNDSIIFFYSGSQLQSKVMQVKDSSVDFVGNHQPGTYPSATSFITDILWDKQPTPFLKVKLYK